MHMHACRTFEESEHREADRHSTRCAAQLTLTLTLTYLRHGARCAAQLSKREWYEIFYRTHRPLSPCLSLVLASFRPCVTLVLTTPCAHVIIVWQVLPLPRERLQEYAGDAVHQLQQVVPRGV